MSSAGGFSPRDGTDKGCTPHREGRQQSYPRGPGSRRHLLAGVLKKIVNGVLPGRQPAAALVFREARKNVLAQTEPGTVWEIQIHYLLPYAHRPAITCLLVPRNLLNL